MAAGTWKIYKSAKKYFGNGTITLGAGVFKLCLLVTSASAAILALSTRSTWQSLTSFAASTRGGYGRSGRNLLPATAQWTMVAGGLTVRFTYTTAGLPITASGSTIGNTKAVKYAIIRNSTGANAGKLLCFCTLSTTAFTVASPNILTIAPSATGVFQMT